MAETERHRQKMVQLHSLDPPRNPKLEKMRNMLIRPETDFEITVQILETCLANIHAAYLFHPKGRPALKEICTVISSTPTLIEYASWKDFAGALELSFLQIGCIENYLNCDHTEYVLRAYAIKNDATLGNVLEALKRIQRYDAITSAQGDLQNLSLVAIHEHKQKLEDCDSGFCSETEGSFTDNLLRPKPEIISRLQSQVAITLKDVDRSWIQTPSIASSDDITLAKQTPNINQNVIENKVQQACVVNMPKPKLPQCNKKVMVTFAEDGEKIARNLAKEFRKPRGNKGLRIGVLILEDHRERVLENPENFITHYFSQMDYIIPILTEGYLKRLGQNSVSEESSMTCLDPQYVQFIHNLMGKYYRQNFVRNGKIRCVIPTEKRKIILNNQHRKLDPLMDVYVYDHELEQLAKRILKIFN